MWTVVYLPDAEEEREAMPVNERHALYNAVAKLQAIGPTLDHPHTSAVRGSPGLRELRPRAGRSPWRALYRQVGDYFVVAAIGPEAEHNLRGFRRACLAAEKRLNKLED